MTGLDEGQRARFSVLHTRVVPPARRRTHGKVVDDWRWLTSTASRLSRRASPCMVRGGRIRRAHGTGRRATGTSSGRHRRARGLVAAGGGAGDRHDRLAPACGSSLVALPSVQADFGVSALGSLAAVHARHARLRLRRHPAMGRLTDRLGVMVRDPGRHRLPGGRLPRRRPVAIALAIRARLRRADRPGHLGDVRAADGRHLALVPQAPRHRRLDLRLRQLSRRHRSGRRSCSTSSPGRLARDPHRLWRRLRSSSCCRWRWPSAAARPSDPRRRRPRRPGRPRRSPLSPGTLQVLLFVAGIGCCVAMSMPQVHIVAYCGDLGYGPARGAEMLSLMLGMGVISRLASGLDRRPHRRPRRR